MDPHPIAHVTPAPRGHREDTRVLESPDVALGGYGHVVCGERCEDFGVGSRVGGWVELEGGLELGWNVEFGGECVGHTGG